MTSWTKIAFLLSALASANCSDEGETKGATNDAQDAAVVIDAFAVATDGAGSAAVDAKNTKPKPPSFVGDAGVDAAPSAACSAPCIAAIVKAVSSCPLAGACVQQKGPPDAGVDLLQCYKNGSVVTLAGAFGGRRVTALTAEGKECFALDEPSQWSILGPDGNILGRLAPEGAEVFVTCGSAKVRDGDCSLPAMSDLVRPCTDGVCALPKPAL